MGNQDKQKRRDILSGNVAKADDFEERQDGKGVARTDMNYGQVEGVQGRTIGGSGSVGTGDPSGDFDRPGTEGRPAQNDYVDHNLQEDTIISNDASEAEEEHNEGVIKSEDPGSGFPLGGAAREGSVDPV